MAQNEKEGPSCASCALSWMEHWTADKDALRCGQPGKYHGRTTEIYPKGILAIVEQRTPPAWCKCFERRT